MRRHGWVESFDDAAGYGYIHAAQEHSETIDSYFFHCTRLADGSRTVSDGTPVSFVIAAGNLGTWEAIDIEVEGEPAIAPDQSGEGHFACPACGGEVEGSVGAYEICTTCGWEDDPVQSDDPSYAGGANTMSLAAARDDFARRQAAQTD